MDEFVVFIMEGDGTPTFIKGRRSSLVCGFTRSESEADRFPEGKADECIREQKMFSFKAEKRKVA